MKNEQFDIERMRWLNHNINAIDRYMSKIQNPGMSDNKQEFIKELKKNLKYITDDDVKGFNKDFLSVYNLSKRLAY